jgi:hypothetical protein
VYYLAVPSRVLAAVPEFTTQLACALPGHPNHKGDGAYLLKVGAQAVAVIREGTRLELICSVSHEVLEAIEDRQKPGHELPTFNVESEQAERLVSRHFLQRTLADKTARLTSYVSLGVIAASLAASLVSVAITGYQRGTQRVTPESLVASANRVIESAQLSQPLAEQMAHIDAISAQVVKTGGWIDGYHYTEADGEAFTVSLPTWVTGDTIKAMGDQVHTELQKAGSNLIWVRQADSKGHFIADIGPEPLPGAPAQAALPVPSVPAPAVVARETPASAPALHAMADTNTAGKHK